MSHQKQLIFRSKVDTWLMLVLLCSSVVGIFIPLKLVIENFSLFYLGLSIVIFLVTAILPMWIFARTYYKFDEKNQELLIQSGPMKWRIPFSHIQSVEESRSSLSSPALSLDRLKITYKNNKSVLVSPREKRKFINLINQYTDK